MKKIEQKSEGCQEKAKSVWTHLQKMNDGRLVKVGKMHGKARPPKIETYNI